MVDDHQGISAAAPLKTAHFLPGAVAARHPQNIAAAGGVDGRKHVAPMIPAIGNQDVVPSQMLQQDHRCRALAAVSRQNHSRNRHPRQGTGEDHQQDLRLSHGASLGTNAMDAQQPKQQLGIRNTDPRPVDGHDAKSTTTRHERPHGRTSEPVDLCPESREHRLRYYLSGPAERTGRRIIRPRKGTAQRREHRHQQTFVSSTQTKRCHAHQAQHGHRRRHDPATAREELGLGGADGLDNQAQEASAWGKPHANDALKWASDIIHKNVNNYL